MTDEQKLTYIKSQLNISDTSLDTKLQGYLDLTETEIINWMYTNYPSVPETATMPSKYDVDQIQAVITAYNLEGGENETSHIENGVERCFRYTDMADYIHNKVAQLVYI